MQKKKKSGFVKYTIILSVFAAAPKDAGERHSLGFIKTLFLRMLTLQFAQNKIKGLSSVHTSHFFCRNFWRILLTRV